MSITFENTPNATVVNISGVNTASQRVELVPGSAIEGTVMRAGGIPDYGITVQVRQAKESK